MIKEAFLRSLMSDKSFVDEIYNEIFMSGEPTPPPPPITSNFLTKNNLPITTKDNLIFNVKE